MMRRIVAYVDLHEGANHELAQKIPGVPRSDEYYLGDNIDLVHCPSRHAFTNYQILQELGRQWRGKIVRGNHELNMLDAPDFLVVGKTLLTHGDYLFWTYEKAEAYRNNRLPAMTQYWHPGTVDFLQYLPRWIITNHFLSQCHAYAKHYNCEQVVCGHAHPTKLMTIVNDGLLINILPRGRTELEIMA